MDAMGGGWSKRGSGVPLADRVRSDRPPPVDPAEACPARHCWVSGAVDAEGVKRPGLLLEWRQVRGRWEGRVTYVARLRPLEADGGWLVVEEWLPARAAHAALRAEPRALGKTPGNESNRWSLGSPAVQQGRR